VGGSRLTGLSIPLTIPTDCRAVGRRLVLDKIGKLLRAAGKAAGAWAKEAENAKWRFPECPNCRGRDYIVRRRWVSRRYYEFNPYNRMRIRCAACATETQIVHRDGRWRLDTSR
jgi:hypothetical protein